MLEGLNLSRTIIMLPPDNRIGALYAFDVDDTGCGVALDEAALLSPCPADVCYRWVHLDYTRPETRTFLAAAADREVAAILTREDTRPRCAPHGEGVLLNLRGVNLNPESDPEDMVSVRMYVTPKLILSARIRRLMAVVSIREAIERGEGPNSVGDFLTTLAAGLTERMDDTIGALAEHVDDLEERSLDTVEALRPAIADLRRDAIILRRYIAPQREALGRLQAENALPFDDHERIALREEIDRVTRLVEELDAIRERAGVLSDQLADRRAEEMNRHMLVLSVVAAVFLPLGFLTGLLGINVGGMPGANSSLAFWIVCGLLVAIGGGLVALFRWMKWV
jgi:zinc transporter